MTCVSGNDGGLHAALVDGIAAAQRDWPALAVPADAFAAYVAARIPDGMSPAEAVGQMHTSDLYLACACARGDAKAFAAFDERCLAQIDRLLAGMGVDADASAEVKQELRSRVLVGDGRAPEILDFTGRGDLRSWVRVMAIRQALRRLERARRDVSVEDDELMQRIVAPGNPGDGLIREDRHVQAELYATVHLVRLLGIDVSVAHQTRDSNVDGQSFQGAVYFVGLAYGFE